MARTLENAVVSELEEFLPNGTYIWIHPFFKAFGLGTVVDPPKDYIRLNLNLAANTKIPYEFLKYYSWAFFTLNEIDFIKSVSKSKSLLLAAISGKNGLDGSYPYDRYRRFINGFDFENFILFETIEYNQGDITKEQLDKLIEIVSHTNRVYMIGGQVERCVQTFVDDANLDMNEAKITMDSVSDLLFPGTWFIYDLYKDFFRNELEPLQLINEVRGELQKTNISGICFEALRKKVLSFYSLNRTLVSGKELYKPWFELSGKIYTAFEKREEPAISEFLRNRY